MSQLEETQIRNMDLQSSKLELEIRAFKQPFLLRVTTWASIIAGLVAFTAGVVQLTEAIHKQRKAELDEKLAQIQLAEAN